MQHIQKFTPLTGERLRDINGGGLAYDIGRVIRFIGLWGGGVNAGAAKAVVDWEINAMINEAENG